MTERELRRTAVIIPPKGRAVLCVWAAVPGLLAAPFVFWQGILPGLVFAALWAVLVFLARCRACSFAAVLGARTLTVYSGIVLPVRQVFPRRAVTGVQQLRTPLLRLAGASVLIISAPGSRMFLPAVPAAQAGALAHALAEELPLQRPTRGPAFQQKKSTSTRLQPCAFCAKRWRSTSSPSSTCCLSGTGPHSGRLCGRTPSCLPCSAG